MTILCIQYPPVKQIYNFPTFPGAHLSTPQNAVELSPVKPSTDAEFTRGLGLFDSTMLVVGVMIGSGIFIVSAEMAREIGSPGWLLVAWAIAGALTIAGALCYGELSAMMPRAGGMYVYLREAYSPLWGFLYGWTLFTVIQTGTIAAVAVAFARFTGVILPGISEEHYLIRPLRISTHYAVSLSTAQLLALFIVLLLTFTNTRGLRYGKIVQNVFTVAKSAALFALIIAGIFIGKNLGALRENFGNFWHIRGTMPLSAGLDATTAFGLFVALCVSQTGSLFSADSWHNIAFAAGEVRNPEKNVTRAMVIGTIVVISLYLLANVAYLMTLPLGAIQHAPSDRVGTATLQAIFPGLGTALMAAAIMVSTFGTINALILTGPRAYYAMARQKLFFRFAGKLNAAKVPAFALCIQGLWAMLLVLPRTYNPINGTWGNLYSDLLDYVISAALIFYVLTVAAVFRLRRTRPDAPRPYRTWGYPVVPAAYVLTAGTILVVLFAYRPETTWPGLAIVLAGLPVYWALRRRIPAGESNAADSVGE
jgi:basic amino acid/polyamine antiporter, APA family